MKAEKEMGDMGYIKGLRKGINLGGWLSQCTYSDEHYDRFISERDIQKIRSWGLDHARLPVDYEVLENEDGTYREKGFSYIDSCVAWCKKAGLRIILDIHKTAGYTFNNAYGAQNNLFTSETLQNRFIGLWKTLAARYGGDADTIVFELLNEVVEEEHGEPWNKLIRRTIEAIREFAPRTQIIVGGIQWNSVAAVRLLDAPYDQNVIYTFHFYEPLAFTHQNAHWVPELKGFAINYPAKMGEYVEAAKRAGKKAEFVLRSPIKEMGLALLETLILEAVEIAAQRGVALYCGEYGVIDQAPADGTLRWYQDVHQLFEKHQIGRAAWSYKEMDFGITDKHYAPILEGIIESL